MRNALMKAATPAIVTLCSMAVWQSLAVAQDKGPPVPTEMKVLEKRVGTWTAVSKAKPAEWTPGGWEAKSDEKVELILQGRAIHGKVRNLTDGSESTWLETYDIHMKAYRFWYFDSRGNIVESGGKWDAKTNTMTWSHMPQPGISAVSHWRLVGNDIIEWDLLAKDQSGKVYLDMTGKLTRKR